MKKRILIILLAVLGFFSIALADQTVTFQWDANSPTPDGYRLFQRTQDTTYDYATPVWQGSETSHSLTLPKGSYAFVVRAFVADNQSGDSNEVLFTVEDQAPPVAIPGRPKQLTIIFE